MIVLTRFSLVRRVISCCRLASIRASGGSCRFWANSCCWRLFSSLTLCNSPRKTSTSFSWDRRWACNWDSNNLHTQREQITRNTVLIKRAFDSILSFLLWSAKGTVHPKMKMLLLFTNDRNFKPKYCKEHFQSFWCSFYATFYITS